MTIQDVQLSPEQWRNFWVYYKNEPQQQEAIEMLRQFVNEADPTLLTNDASWVQKFRQSPPPGPVSNTWDGIKEAARIAGAKFPECVAAQWALESGYGKSVSGKNNYFGIKGRGTTCSTWEDYGNGPVQINASFRDFESPQECVSYLVDRWYKDYQGYKGVNRASSPHECCQLLKAEGYATDPAYVTKLCTLLDQHA